MQSVLQSPPAGSPAPEAGVYRQISIQTNTEGQAATVLRAWGRGDELGCVLSLYPQPGFGSLGFHQVGLAVDNGVSGIVQEQEYGGGLFVFYFVFVV